ncbi:uncharacterized protein CANTADRAFT_100989 [Suhomyces tanzawaensis NRRL Y-17324]|uniref:Uncharacterized protein n=1 Tax=Suhomyces tanzawaensis NRRL Y-17324 TaxID=984487 RepID=A0A1E4SIZ6_9ASCO|nr:uncharacterized protein CANTADRAFT_100989 [Suhomyces tanzawaensis NRRL Y-17324]ODV79483.1 hypothetical protein CANTADRAFT_100989 [Suhomyces tanzawaensis NRRL Y-17324]
MSSLESVIRLDNQMDLDPLSEKDFNITTSLREILTRKLTKGQLTTSEVLEAFIKRPVVDGARTRALYLEGVRSKLKETDRLSSQQLQMLSQLYYREQANSRVPRIRVSER